MHKVATKSLSQRMSTSNVYIMLAKLTILLSKRMSTSNVYIMLAKLTIILSTNFFKVHEKKHLYLYMKVNLTTCKLISACLLLTV